MGKVKTKRAASADLTIRLFAPGMTPLHRAGVGGLAATLIALKRRRQLGLIAETDLPGEWTESHQPWTLDPDQITLHFGATEGAGDYLRKLFAFAFGIKDNLIDLPGTYRDELSRAVRAELQFALTLTFLQFGPHRDLEPETTLYFDVAGDGAAEIAIALRRCHSFLHQEAIQRLRLLDKNQRINLKATETPSAFNPGAVVRHNAFGTETRIEEIPAAGLSACFAIVGCLSLAVNRGVGVLLVPEVDDLLKFARARPRMTPSTLRECRIAGATDAALQAQSRLRAKGEMHRHGLAGVYAIRFRPTQWNEKQKTRVAAVRVPPGEDDRLSRFDVALRHLPPRIRSKTVTISQGRGRNRMTTKKPVFFWVDSVVRPLVADNLASDRRWYDGFTRLMAERDGSQSPNHERISYESEGLHDMLSDTQNRMTQEDELALIAAVHRAVYMQRGKIYADTMGDQARERGHRPNTACYNRWSRLMERLRLGLIGAKTADQTRRLLHDDIFGRAGTIKDLRSDETLQQIHRLIFHDDWRRLRDLTMLAVVSYKAPPGKERLPGDHDDEQSPA